MIINTIGAGCRRFTSCGKVATDPGPQKPKEDIPLNGKKRTGIKPGTHVKIVRKQDQRSGKLTEGVVKDVLTHSPTHPHGIKVRLESGVVGRVKEVR